MKIATNNLTTLIEPHFCSDLTQKEYEIKSIHSNQLLTYNRFDLAFKLLYLEMLDKNISFTKDIYKKHIEAFSLGTFIEPGNEDKNTIEKFIEEFKNIFEDIKINGFNSSKSIIPLSKNNSIANGAHRIASAIYLNKIVDCVEIYTANQVYDYKFFHSRNIDNNTLDIVATKFTEYATNVHIAFLWPIGKDTTNVQNIIPHILYKKTIKLTPNGSHNLLSQIYYGEEWIGSVEDDFKGSKGKLVECFKTFDEFEVIAFQADSLEDVLKIKDDIRDVFNVGKHSVHITDTKDEAIRVAHTIFNDNSLHFLNYSKPNKYIDTNNKIEEFKKFLYENNISSKDVVIDSSFILACYGLREAKDTDFLCDNNNKIIKEFKDINTHDEELKYYNTTKNEMIYNPKNYFYFNDIKFVSFNIVYNMKQNRAEQKDINDCKMMEALIEDNRYKEFISKLKQNILYTKIKFRAKLMSVLKTIGLYDRIKKVVRRSK